MTEKTCPGDPQLRAKIEQGDGFIAALDQSGGSTPGALKGFGISEDRWNSDDEMFALIHDMRSRIIRSSSFGSGKIIGAILFEKTMDGEVGGDPAPEALKERGIVPFLKVDKGLEDERDGVQLMKPIPDLDALLDKAVEKGMFGTKMRSVIKLANERGISEVVRQQFELARQILAKGLIPIVEPEVSIKSPEREAADRILLKEILNELDRLEDGQCVMLKLTIPAEPNLFAPLVNHPKVLKVVALSGGFSREEACTELKKNQGIIASFSRALLADLKDDMDDDEFDAALGKAIDEIYEASVA
ncbi:fructose bisphosphate aldolase [Sphingomonas sp. HDW15A]|uniref:fructose bisphosphate aldolase n=1 Tax=Sphingomonas sp. HDW15A TaxID=2714942 RepID=UPI00140A0531|nr:fructose bisphosphate aldolase [Sphingomonas sp. HDW15A]QIK95791.1 fructose bisphosphate aldolase [Sphingomonas sp. HDW15A]